nr:MAG TPA: hypothetical protein [Caudoviricetes sp.]DAU14437.1 MAG TPA: hypothetical protein [Caudoviricetes sp.]
MTLKKIRKDNMPLKIVFSLFVVIQIIEYFQPNVNT